MENKVLVNKIYDKMLSKGLILVEVSARHVHLSEEDLYYLFGHGYQLTYVKELSQKGQYLCKERVDISGPKGTIRDVAILGPCRIASQVELAASEARKLGINAPVRLSGDIKKSAGITISLADKFIEKEDCVIIAKRHVHMTQADASRLGIVDGEVVDVKILSDRALTFEDTIVRINEEFSLAMHIDVDEANACGLSRGGYGLVRKASKL